MVNSMTGFGVSTVHIGGTTVSIEIKSVNSRYLDLISKIPRSLSNMEFKIKKLIQGYFHRGRIEVYISHTGEPLTNKSVQVNWDLVGQYITYLTEVKDRYQLKGDIPLSAITAEESLFSVEDNGSLPESTHPLLCTGVEQACKEVLENRQQEGTFLMSDILQHLGDVEIALNEISSRQHMILTHYRDRIKERIGKQLQQWEVDEAHLQKEIAILAERGDIQEELTRLFSHIAHFKQIVTQNGPIGRRLEFITQEMNREINTIGSKSVDTRAGTMVIDLKDSLEKIKEQVQNIE